MKNMLFVTGGLLLSTLSFAAQENAGVTYCSFADAVCQSADQNIVACPFGDFTYVAVRTLPNESSYRFATQRVAVPQGIVGAGDTYEGDGVRLYINTDVYGGPQGLPASLTVQSLGINNQALRCTFNSH